jgi:hypothetical protein
MAMVLLARKIPALSAGSSSAARTATDLERSNAELRAALRIAAERIQKLNFDAVSTPG